MAAEQAVNPRPFRPSPKDAVYDWDTAIAAHDALWDDPYALCEPEPLDLPSQPTIWAHRLDHSPPWHGDAPELIMLRSFANYVKRLPLRPTTNRDLELSRNGWASQRRRQPPSPPSFVVQIDHVRRLAQRLVAALDYQPWIPQDTEQLVKLTQSIAVNAAGIRAQLMRPEQHGR